MRVRVSTLFAVCLAAGSGLMLFQTSQNVQRAEDRLSELRQALTKEQETVRVLETEWDYLNRPDRIEHLASQYLGMRTPLPDALLSDSSQVPEPGIVPVPGRKPVFAAQPAVAYERQQAQSAPVPDPVRAPDTPPMPAPVTNDSQQRFQDLVNSLTEQEPAAGGTP